MVNTRLCGEKQETITKKEQGVLKKKVDEFCLSLHQSREAEFQLSQEKETLEQEFSDANEARQQGKVELERKEVAIKRLRSSRK